MNGLERYAILSTGTAVCVPDNRLSQASHLVPQTSVEGVEGEEGGPMIRRHGTCMLTCTMPQTEQI